MPRAFKKQLEFTTRDFSRFFSVPPLKSLSVCHNWNSEAIDPLNMIFEDHLRTFKFYHLEGHKSRAYLLQVLQEDEFARKERL